MALRRVTEGRSRGHKTDFPLVTLFPKGLQTVKSGRRFKEDRRLLSCFGECKLVTARRKDIMDFIKILLNWATLGLGSPLCSLRSLRNFSLGYWGVIPEATLSLTPSTNTSVQSYWLHLKKSSRNPAISHSPHRCNPGHSEHD